VTKVILSIRIAGQDFHGIKVEVQDALGMDWPRPTALIWAVETKDGITLPTDLPRDPLESQLDYIIGHFEMNGDFYFAVKWLGRTLPSWEMEADMDSYVDSITTYFRSLITRRHCSDTL
jgi:hypothetical protein